MFLIQLALKNIVSRRTMALLLIISISLSVTLLVGIQTIKISAKKSFSNSISGTDLIVGSKSGSFQLLLYSLFRQGPAIPNIKWETVM